MAKKVIFKILKIDDKNSPLKEFSYKSALIEYMKVPKNIQTGMDFDEIRQSGKIIDVLENAQNEVIMENADFQYLFEKVKKVKLSYFLKPFLTLIEDLEESSKNDIDLNKK